jgi:hypothetical protein
MMNSFTEHAVQAECESIKGIPNETSQEVNILEWNEHVQQRAYILLRIELNP